MSGEWADDNERLCVMETCLRLRRGRQKKRWEDNIKERTGMDFASSARQLKTGQDRKGLL